MAALNLAKFRNKHFLSLTANGIISLFGLVLIGLLYRTFSKEDVGTWFFFMATQAMLDSVRNGFLGTATVKFYAGADAERSANVMGSVWFLAIMITGLMLLINAGALALMPLITNRQIIVCIEWVGLTLLGSLPYSVMFWKLQADERYGAILWMRLVNNGSTIVAFLVLIFLHRFTLETALLWNFITNCITSAAGLLANLGGVKHLGRRSRETVMELYHFGKYSLATSLSSNLMRTVDTYIITFMLGPGALAILNLPWRLMELVEIPLRSFVATGMSSMAAAFNQGNMNEMRRMLNKYAGMLTLAFIPMAVAVLFLADIPVLILSSGKYADTEAANLFRIGMFVAILYPIDRFNGVALDIVHQPKVNFQKVQLMLLFKIVGDVVFISVLHSVYAIPMAGLVTMFAGMSFGYVKLNKFIPFRIKDILSTGLREVRAFTLKKG